METASKSLSKSQFVRGIICPKSLYLHKHKFKKDEVQPQQQAVLDAGTRLGRLAQEVFPGGIEVPFEGMGHDEQVAMTAREIAAGREVIYEATFKYDDIFVKADILRKTSAGWEMYEVKGSNSIKDYYLHDASVQYYVLTGAGLTVSKAAIMHLNREYVRQGDLNLDRLFAVEDLTATVRAQQNFVREEVARLRGMLDGPEPDVKIGPYCDDPYECDYHGHCWKDVGDDAIDSVFKLNGRGVDRFALYNQGITRMAEIPLSMLNRRQLFQVQATLHQKDHLHPERIRDFLAGLWYPLYYLDFETFMSSIPLFDRTRPFQQVPFQYSLHYRLSEDGPLEHDEYLAEPGTDPRPILLEKLRTVIPPGACVLAYNMSFEVTRLKEMARDFPEYREWVDQLVPNVRDLMHPFIKRDCYRWQMNGSASIKKVLPAMTTLSYDGLEIADGGAAMDAYHVMCAEQDPAELAKLRKNLLLYCGRDTEAMVELHAELKKLSLFNSAS